MKKFVPKNGLPRLTDYKGNPGQQFWDKFPINLVADEASLIKVDKLYELGSKLGTVDQDRLEKACKDLRHGADIGCKGAVRGPSRSTNAASAFEHPEQVTDAVATWAVKRFVYGPVPLGLVPVDAKVNGIMVRPKPDGGVRIILNMSAPVGNCVNEGINNDEFPAKMSSTRKWLEVLEKAGRQCLIMKMDWADAYKHIRVRKEDRKLQWFSWLGMYFMELCLIFGTVSSVGIYDRVAKVVLEIVLGLSRFNKELICQHLDDVCAAAPAGSTTLHVFEDTYRKVAAQVGVKLAPSDDPEKAFSPCTKGTVLGVTYDTMNWTWQIPPAKVARLVHQIHAALEADQLRQDEIWSMAGRIMHYAPLVPAGRFNLNYIIRASSVSEDRRFMVEVTAAMKRQLYFWLLMIRVSSGLAMIPAAEGKWPAWTRECYTDAAGGSMEGVGRGAGCVSQEWWAYVPWGKKINCGVKAEDGKKLSRKLSALELVGPLICVAAGQDWCRNRPVRIWVDNFGSVQIWQKGYSNCCPLCTTLVKAISTVAAGLGCRVTLEKIRRCSSTGAVLADALSKADFNAFRRVAGTDGWPLQVAPALVPVTILQWIENPVSNDELGAEILRELQETGAVLS